MKRGIEFYVKLILVILFLAGFLGYAGYQSRKLLSGPEIRISSPIDGETVASSTITISGQVSDATNISLDDNPIVMDEAGNFKEERVLMPGLNIIKIRVENQFKKTAEKILQIVYKPAVN
ncbi:MAG: hypothetical protein PHS53_02295 [Candidatus Pacebacteria bacterium]|nr:hypothetical protein [Candidatus Paceibacterota bacterium]MDD5356956.1 hypothetical protein [Candidatus Paceibacterota bacterium]